MTDAHEKTVAKRITLRPVASPEDHEFLRELYYSVRDDLRGILPDGDQLRLLLDMQFNAQGRAYADQFPCASHDIILLDEERVGRVMVDRRPDSIYLVDLALLPDFRNLGIGKMIFERLFEECSSRGIPITLRVLKTNRAQTLYERLGFRVAADEETHLYMKWER